MKRRRAPLLASLEAAYSAHQDAAAWFADLVAALAPTLDLGLGVQGLRVEFRPGARTLHPPVLVGGTDSWRRHWLENWWVPVIEAVAPEALEAMLSFGTVSSAQQLWDAAARGIPTLDAHLKVLAEHGWARAFRRPGRQDRLFYLDSLNLCVIEPSGEGLALIANREEVLATGELRKARRRFARVAAHLATALRARSALDGRAPTSDDGEAVLTPGGRILHATGAALRPGARAALQQAARDLDRARARSSDEDEALTLWRCLVDGRWTLLDEFESDGTRYVIALPNELHASTPALSEREAHVLAEVARGLSNKEIAYALGLAPSTVSTLVTRGATKLGATSRVDLVRKVHTLRSAPSGDRTPSPHASSAASSPRDRTPRRRYADSICLPTVRTLVPRS